MKRTRRRKDWDQATALGLQMLKRGDEAGWLQLFDAERVMLAERLLPMDPLHEHGIERLVAEAREATMLGLDPRLGDFLPDVRLHFVPGKT